MEGEASVDHNRAQEVIMRKLVIALILGLALSATAKEQETIDQLKLRAAAADQKHQPELYSRLAQMQLDSASDLYATNPEQARDLVTQSADSAEKASAACVASGKRDKKTEIDLRQLGKRMDDVIRTWAFDDRAQVESAVKRVETARSKILDRMFEK
jgi:hypothetical protein